MARPKEKEIKELIENYETHIKVLKNQIKRYEKIINNLKEVSKQ